MAKGESVTVIARTTVWDDHGERVDSISKTVVEDVLFAPTSTATEGGVSHPDRRVARATLYFPADFDMDLAGAEVEVRGQAWRVAGTPERHTHASPYIRRGLAAGIERGDG